MSERRKFARSWMIGFPVIAAIFSGIGLILGRGIPTWTPWLAVIGAAVGGLLYLVPQIAPPFYVIWYFIACCIGLVVSNALLVVFYFLIITPFGLVMRALGRDPMNRSWDPDAATYWREAEKSIDPERYFRQF